MVLAALDNVQLSFSQEIIIEGASLQVRRGERTALVGRNGAGKTSLLEILAGNIQPDSGSVVIDKSTTIGYLKQVPDPDDAPTLLDVVISGRSEIIKLRRDISRLEEKAEAGDGRAVETLGNLRERYEHAGGDDLERMATVALQNVGFDRAQFDQPTNLLSGGERSRLMLARILLMDADLLLLDEPTNHLDLRGIEFLEQYLSAFKGGALVVTHDRVFIDKFATGIAAIEPDRSLSFCKGGYEKYTQLREARREQARKEFAKQQSEIERHEELIRRTHAGKGQRGRQAKSRRKLLERMDVIEPPAHEKKPIGLFFPEIEHSGKVVFKVKDLTLRPGGQVLLEKVSFNVQRGEKVGIIGPNGCGKTTLLEVLALKEQPAQGVVQHGYHAEIGYYDQNLSGLTTGRTVLEELAACRPDLPGQALRDMAGRFLFHGDDVTRPVETFSGGEQSHLALVLLVLGRTNVLLLDEPTNHLDIPSREVLEEALQAFPGTIVTVSHDRFFLDRVAKRILSIENRGLVDESGVYSELRQQRKIMHDVPREAVKSDPEKQRRREDYHKRKRDQRSKEGDQKRMTELEALVHQQEKQIEKLQGKMADPSMAFDWEGLEKLQSEKNALEQEHEANLAEWEELATKMKTSED